jgi:hypothetical protein
LTIVIMACMARFDFRHRCLAVQGDEFLSSEQEGRAG